MSEQDGWESGHGNRMHKGVFGLRLVHYPSPRLLKADKRRSLGMIVAHEEVKQVSDSTDAKRIVTLAVYATLQPSLAVYLSGQCVVAAVTLSWTCLRTGRPKTCDRTIIRAQSTVELVQKTEDSTLIQPFYKFRRRIVILSSLCQQIVFRET